MQNERTCQAIFEELLALEFSDPAYGAVHLLTVACYWIQHRKYSDDGLAWIEGQLRASIEQGRGSDEIRQQVKREMGWGTRTWRVNRQPGERPLADIAWSMTIADVARNYTDARSYREQITRWARSVLAEMQPWLEK